MNEPKKSPVNGQRPAARPENTPDPESKKSRVKKRKGMSKLPKLFAFLFVSFVAVFCTVYYSVNRHVTAQAAIIESQPDSTSVPISVPADTIDNQQQEMEQIEQDPTAKMNLVEQLYWLKARFQENSTQMVEMYESVADDKENLSMEVRELREENARQRKDLQYYQETLPDNIAKKLVEIEQQRMSQTIAQSRASQGAAGSGQAGTGGADVDPGIRALAKIYEAMRPDEAAPILVKMDVDKVVQILLRMRQRNAAKIMSSFDSDYAARISRKLGGGQ